MILQHINALNAKRIVLASGSPRRKELLKNLGLKFEVRHQQRCTEQFKCQSSAPSLHAATLQLTAHTGCYTMKLPTTVQTTGNSIFTGALLHPFADHGVVI